MNTESAAQHNTPVSDIFIVKKANEWTATSEPRPVSKMLFDEFWLEGELAVLFADIGTGKSLLAVQIAESIARGTPFGSMQMTATAQPVVHIDLKFMAGQFEIRYSAVSEEGDLFIDKYTFSDNLVRVEPKADAAPDALSGRTLCHAIEALVKEAGAKVVVLDNITYLRTSNQDTREELQLIRDLDRLKRRLGLSILVLANSSRHDRIAPVSINDLQHSRTLADLADTVFAIGRSRSDESLRYVKHIRSKSTETYYHGANVPTFRIKRLDGNFLGFDFEAFADENSLLNEEPLARDWTIIDEIKELADSGMTIRQIAARLDISKTKAHRLLQMWEPPSEPDGGEGAAKVHNSFYFPGCEEYEEARTDPKFNEMYDREDAEAYALRSESFLISVARAKARKRYEATGTTPRLAEMLEQMSADEAERKERNSFVVNAGGQVIIGPEIVASGEMAGLKRGFDANDKEIFIEAEDKRGRPMVWYNFDSKGVKRRCVRGTWGISIEKIREAGHRASYKPVERKEE